MRNGSAVVAIDVRRHGVGHDNSPACVSEKDVNCIDPYDSVSRRVRCPRTSVNMVYVLGLLPRNGHGRRVGRVSHLRANLKRQERDSHLDPTVEPDHCTERQSYRCSNWLPRHPRDAGGSNLVALRLTTRRPRNRTPSRARPHAATVRKSRDPVELRPGSALLPLSCRAVIRV